MTHCFRHKGHRKSIQSLVLYPVKKYSYPGVYALFKDDTVPHTERAEWCSEQFDEYEKKDGNHMVLTSHSSHLLDDAFGHS